MEKKAGGAIYVLDAPSSGASPVTFIEGHPQAQFSIGSGGVWRVMGAGVLEIHGFLGFDGARFFVRSAVPNSPLLVNDRPVPLDWTPIAPPCRLRIGAIEATLAIAAPPVQQPRTSTAPTAAPLRASAAPPAMPAPMPLRASAAPPAWTRAGRAPTDANGPPTVPNPRLPPKPGVPGDAEMTRVGAGLADLVMLPVPPVPPDTGRRGSGSGELPIAPMAPAIATAAPTPEPAGPRPAAAPAKTVLSAALRRQQTQTRILGGVALAASVAAAVFIVRTRQRPPAGGPPAPVAVPALDWPESSAPTRGVVVYPVPRAADDPERARMDAGAGPSLERAAVDALHRGDLEAAATAYEALAKQHPENPAYARAVRTLRRP